MSDEKEPKCLNCGSGDDEVVLLSCVKGGEETWVCVHCLPMLIHGAH